VIALAEDHEELQRRQAQVWAPWAERLLDGIGVGAGWTCADLGCGPVGILPELSRRVGPEGRVVGLERDPDVAESARRMAARERLGNVEIVAADLAGHSLPRASFDLVHARFLLHLTPPEEAIAAMVALARPGRWVAVEECDLSTWRYLPDAPGWGRLLALLSEAIGRRCDPSIGRRVPALMERAGVSDLQARAGWLLMRDRDPYMRLPLRWAGTERREILDAGLASADELDGLVAELERHVERPEVMMLTLTTVQAWGRT
jgi:SAM-dependent methyltransferase